jgi:hypothetical protein
MSRANRIARLVAIQQDTEFVLLKHRQGKHDQATHGSWDTDRSNNKKSDFKYGVQDAIDKVIKGEVGKVVPTDAEFWLDKMADREDNPDLTNLEIVGTQLFTRDNLGIMRDEMPQVPYERKGEFISEMEKRGIAVTRENVSPQKLHPIQAEISAKKSGKLAREIKQNGHGESDGARIIVSSDDYIIDGHHRWAASAFLSLKDEGQAIPVLRVDMTHMELIDATLAWNKATGIESLSLDKSTRPFKKAWVEFELAVIKGILATEIKKHLAGQHDQKSHGVRGAGLNPEVASDIVRFTQEWGGLSINMVDGSMPKTGYMVAKPPSFGKIVDAVDFSDPVKGPKILSDYMKRHKNDLGNGKNYLGTWLNDGKVYLDVSENIQSKSTATRIGRERNQKAIWDVANLDEIDTGGTGLVEKGSQDGGVEEHLGDDRRGDRRIRTENLGKSSGEERLTVFVKPPVVKHLAGQHDQSSHGSWAGTTSLGSGSGLSALEISNLKRGAGTEETQQAEVYKAETEARKENQLIGTLEEPRFSSFRVNPYTYTTAEERAFKKAWNKWETEKYKHIESDLGNKHLDGTIRGVRNYANEIFDSEWFREEYGVPSTFSIDNGKKFAEHQPEIKTLTSKKFGGMYRFRDYNIHGKRSSIEIRNDSLKYEPTILHEIAHYATAISATNKHSGHGKEFAYNNLKIAKQFMPKYAIALERYYKEMGISYE